MKKIYLKISIFLILSIISIIGFNQINRADISNNAKKSEKEDLVLNNKPIKKIVHNESQIKEKNNNKTDNLSSFQNQVNSGVKISSDTKKEVRVASLNSNQFAYFMNKASAQEILEYYEKNGLDINDPINHPTKDSIFMFLISSNPEAAKELYATGLVDISKSPNALGSAIRISNPETIEWLLDIGYDPNGNDKTSLPPYIYAFMGNRLDVAQMLAERGADIKKIHNGKDALEWAIPSSKTDENTLKTLLDHGFEFTENSANLAAKYGRSEKLDFILKTNPELYSSKKNGKDLLETAVTGTGNIKTIQYLLDKGFELKKSHLDLAYDHMIKSPIIFMDRSKVIKYKKNEKLQKTYDFIKDELKKKGVLD